MRTIKGNTIKCVRSLIPQYSYHYAVVSVRLRKCTNSFVLMLSEGSIGNKIELVKQFSADIATPNGTISFIPAVGYFLFVYSLLDFPKPHFVGLVEWHTRVRCIHGALPEVEMVSCPEALGTQFGVYQTEDKRAGEPALPTITIVTTRLMGDTLYASQLAGSSAK